MAAYRTSGTIPDSGDIFSLKDEYDRTEACRSFYQQKNHELLLDPVVSRHLHANGYRLDLPEGKPFAVCLTHDIDDIYPTIHHRALSTIYHLRKMDLCGVRREVFWKKDREGSYSYRNFRDIMQMEDRYGAKSSFYVMATDQNIQPARLYDVEVLESELGEIADSGWEVGLHGGYFSYDSAEAISKEKRRLEKVLGRSVTGYRNHWLRIKVPDTWEHLKAAGFRYDTTLGYNDVPGFRNGMCHPFRPFNSQYRPGDRHRGDTAGHHGPQPAGILSNAAPCLGCGEEAGRHRGKVQRRGHHPVA